MPKPKNWLKMVKTDPLPVLLQKAPLPIQMKTARRFFPGDQDLLEKLNLKLDAYPQREKLLKAQQPDGTWKLTGKYQIEEHKKGMQFLQQLQRMTQLCDYACTKENPFVQKALIGLLKMQKPDGKFPLLFHHHAYALMLLIRFGLLGNPFVEKGFRWIAKRQRKDGGWLSPSMVPSNVSVRTTKSGIWTTLLVFEAFSHHSRLKNSATTQKATEFVLENYLEHNHTSLFAEKDAWSFLYTDYSDSGLFRGGTLRFVEALAPLPEVYDHPNFKKAIDWLIEQQLPSGLFPAIAGRSKEGDFGVTFRVAAALKSIDEENNS